MLSPDRSPANDRSVQQGGTNGNHSHDTDPPRLPVAAKALLFRSSLDSAARWRATARPAVPRARNPPVARNRRPDGNRLRAGVAARARASGRAAQSQANPVARRRGRPPPRRSAIAAPPADRPPLWFRYFWEETHGAMVATTILLSLSPQCSG